MKRYSDEVKERAREMYASGMTLAEVAQVIGCQRESVRKWVETRSRSEARLLASKHSEETRDRAREMYSSGMTLAEVAQVIGCVKATVSRWVDVRPRTPEGTIERARELYASGMSIRSVARAIGRSESSIRRWVDVRPRNYPEETRDRAREMYASGMSIEKVAGEIGCSAWAVHSWVDARSLSEAQQLRSGITTEQRNARAYRMDCTRNRSASWRAAVLDEYRVGRRYQCACCRETFRRQHVQVDHIVPLVELMERHGLFDCDLETFDAVTVTSDHALFDVANGRVLCKACHKSTETYGKGALSYMAGTQTTLIDANGGTP